MIDSRIAPESNLQLQAANASAEADAGVVNSLYVTENALSIYAVE